MAAGLAQAGTGEMTWEPLCRSRSATDQHLPSWLSGTITVIGWECSGGLLRISGLLNVLDKEIVP